MTAAGENEQTNPLTRQLNTISSVGRHLQLAAVPSTDQVSSSSLNRRFGIVTNRLAEGKEAGEACLDLRVVLDVVVAGDRVEND